jgi:pimeloyl-ACP methyl ester carboxylesterase
MVNSDDEENLSAMSGGEKRRMQRKFLFYVIPLIAATALLSLSQQHTLSNFLALRRVSRDGPMRGRSKLRGLPTLILCGDRDTLVPPAIQGERLCAAIGPSCQFELLPREPHDGPEEFAPAPILAFLHAHAQAGTTVILLHGYGGAAREWSVLPASPAALDYARVALARALHHAGYPVLVGDFGSQSWGDDAALHALEQMVGQRPHIVIVAESMGGALMWRYAEHHPSRVSALVGLSPVCSLSAMARGPLGGSVLAAYRLRQ